MRDLAKMTLERLRALARELLGPGQSRKTKPELVAALARAKKPSKASRPKAAGRAARGEDAGKARKKADAGKARRKPGGANPRRKAPSPAHAGREGRASAAARPAAGGAGPEAGPPARAAARARAKARPVRSGGPDPDGYFVARVRGEDAVREAPHPMAETTGDGWAEPEEPGGVAALDERLGDLPWGYGDDAFAALPRDPRTLFLYWDWAQETLARGFEGLDHPRTQLWIFVREGGGWERARVLELALESRGFYVHDLAPGRAYRAELHVVDRAGRERLLGAPSSECALPPSGPSPVVEDRFVRIPWDLALGQLLGPGHAGAPFADDVRAQLARLSDWSRFSGPAWGGSAGGMGGRPFSPTSSPSSPSGGGER